MPALKTRPRPRKTAPAYDILDVKQLVTAALDGFCEEFGVSGKERRKRILFEMADQARGWKLYQDENPIQHVSVGRRRLVREKRKLTDDETRRLLAALPGDVRLMAMVALFAGLRISEVLGLQERHLDFVNGLINIDQRFYRGNVDTVKSQKAERSVPMGYLIDDLRKVCMGDPERFVFSVQTHVTGKGHRECRDDNSIRRYFLRPAAEAIGCYTTGFGWHALRREAVTAFNASLGVTQAMRLAGHSTADMSADYTLADRQRQDRAVRDRQERILGEIKQQIV
jgi:integrase